MEWIIGTSLGFFALGYFYGWVTKDIKDSLRALNEKIEEMGRT